MTSFAEIERIIARYDAATTELDAAVTARIADSLDASYRNLERELRRLYPLWQSEGSLYAVQRRLLLMEQLGEALAVVRPELQSEYERLFTEALSISHSSGGKMADELVRARDPGYPLAEFTSVPIEAAVAQARDGVQRLYRYNDEFKTAVSGVVEQGLIQGWGAEKVARMLRGNEQMQGQFGLAQLKSKAETIARTEIMGSFDRATQQRYAENGITHIQWLATPSERLCSFCLARHGNVYKLGEVTAPSHPRCRCITTSWLPKWQERGWTDDAAIAADRTQRLEEMAKLGTKPNYGPTYWEKRAGLAEAPQAVWKPGDAVPKAEARARPEPKPKRSAKKSSLQVFEDSIVDLPFERLAAFKNGRKVLERDGTKGEVQLQNKDFKKLAGAVVVHNHPLAGTTKGAGFSPGDIQTALVFRMKEARVVSGDYVYSLKPNDVEWSPKLNQDIDKLDQSIWKKYDKAIKAKVADPKTSYGEGVEYMSQSMFDYSHEAATEIAKKYGFTYTRELRGTP